MINSQKKIQEEKLCKFHINSLNRFINLKPSQDKEEEINKEATKVVELLLALSKKEQESLKELLDIKPAPSVMQSDIQVERKSEPTSQDPNAIEDAILKPLLYSFILNSTDFETLSIYLKSVASPELKKKIEELLKAQHDKEYKEFMEAVSIDATIHYQEAHRNDYNALNTEAKEIEEFNSLLLAIPEFVIEEGIMLIEEIEKEIEKGFEGKKGHKDNENSIDANDKSAPSSISEKPQQPNLHEKLKETFNKLDSNNKAHFNAILRHTCENHTSKDAHFCKSLESTCKAFDKLSIQQSKNNSNKKTENLMIKR